MQLEIGTISHGALRSEDLASAIISVAETIPEEGFPSDLLSDLRYIALDDRVEDSETDSEVISEAIDALQEYAPPYCYVGMHPGDGSDLGVWPDIDAIEMDIRDGELQKVGDISEIDNAENRELVAIVNDHGNLTLARVEINATEIWSVV